MVKGKQILEEVRILLDDVSYSRYHEINQAYRKICKLTKFKWLRVSDELLLSFQSATTNYQLDTSVMRVLTGIFVKGGNDARWRLLEEAPQLLFEQRVKETQDVNGTDTTSKPAWYKLEGGPVATLSITPTPDQDYTVRVDYIEATMPIVEETDVNIPGDYFDTVAMLAAGYILERSPDQIRMIHGQRLVKRAMGEFEGLVRDSHPNHTFNIDRTPMTWVR